MEKTGSTATGSKCVTSVLMVALLVLSSAQQGAGIACYSCPEPGKMSSCAPADFGKVQFKLINCSSDATACGKTVSWNPKPPTMDKYVGSRDTVRELDYRYCVSEPQFTGCRKTESTVTSAIECVCESNECNSGMAAASIRPASLAASLLLLLLLRVM